MVFYCFLGKDYIFQYFSLFCSGSYCIIASFVIESIYIYILFNTYTGVRIYSHLRAIISTQKYLYLESERDNFFVMLFCNKNFHECSPYLKALSLKFSGKSSKDFLNYASFNQTSSARRRLRHFFQTSIVQSVAAYHTTTF